MVFRDYVVSVTDTQLDSANNQELLYIFSVEDGGSQVTVSLGSATLTFDVGSSP